MNLEPGRREVPQNADGVVLAMPDDARASDAVAYHLGLGEVSRKQGRFDDAVACYRAVVELQPSAPEAHNDLGNALVEQGRLDAAVACYRRAIALRPAFAAAHSNLGNALRAQRHLDDAIDCYRRALELDPNAADAHLNLGNALRELDLLDEAVTHYRRAIELKPGESGAHVNLGNALKGLGHLEAAMGCYHRAIDLDPGNPGAHNNLAMLLLRRGDMASGWAEHEWRWRTAQMRAQRRDFTEPQWRGEAASGRTLLLHAEQGFGDTLQFCRYATLAAARGLRVIMEVQRPLVRLLRSVSGVAQVIARGDPLPRFDLHCPMLSMPLAFGTTVETVPAPASYLRAGADRVAVWQARLAGLGHPGRRIGLAWAGGSYPGPLAAAVDRQRSIAPDRLAPLLAVPGLHVVSLQKDGTPAPDHFRLTDWMPEMADFADTAALIANLDLVICVDTAVAHLAGALGVPVWLLDRFDSCWRWLDGRRDSPWYPTLRLYRQSASGDWQAVIDAVARDLAKARWETATLAPEGTTYADAVRAHQAGRLDTAERLCGAVLAANPGHADVLHLLGVLAYQAMQPARAAELFERAIAAHAGVAGYHSSLGAALRRQGKPEEAIISFRNGLALAPDDAEIHYNLGNTLKEQERLAEAESCYRRALALRPAFPEALFNLGNIAKELERPDEAIACFRGAIAHRPDYPAAYNNLAYALKEQGRSDEAIDCYRTALALRPDFPEAHSNIGTMLQEQGRLDEALESYRKAIELRPDDATAHNNLGILLLLRGEMAEGWREYEWRWRTPQMLNRGRAFARPQWRGEEAAGKTLLLHAEQGFGDTLQFCRYATIASERGLRVIIEVQPALVRLLRGVPGVAEVVARGDALPPFDLHCPMLGMPLAFGTIVETIPPCPGYLRAEPAQVASWRARLASLGDRGKRVGLVWAGNPRRKLRDLAAIDRRRSIAPEQLAPLLAVPGVQFFSLQKDGPPAPATFGLIDFMSEMEDFADTAALIANLDLVISVDTAVAHLAAGLGVPVWVLDRFDSCWRWLVGRRDSPWYPGLRLYRQPRPGDWDAVLDEAARDLNALAAPTPKHIYTDAVRLHQAGLVEDAAGRCREVLAADPRHEDALHLLGVIAHQGGDDEAAADLIGRAIAIDARRAAYHCGMGVVRRRQGKLEEAAACYGRALALEPGDAEIHYNLGNLRKQQGRLAEADACYRAALARRLDFPEAHFNLGNALTAMGRPDEAIACYRNAIASRPNYARAYDSLTQALERQGRAEEALDCLRQAADVMPDDAGAHHAFANALKQRGRLADAVACYRRAAALKPDDPVVHHNLGVALREAGRLDEAAASYRRAVALDPRFPEAYFNLGNVLREQDRPDEAIACFRRAIEFRPGYANAFNNLGYALKAQGDIEGALASYRQAIALKPELQEAHNNLGTVLQELGRLDEALAAYRRAVELGPDDAMAHNNLGMLLLQHGDMAAGWREYEWRWKTPQMRADVRVFAQPRWRGEPAADGTLLLTAEQGFGDTLQFCRYATLAAELGLRVVMEVPRPLLRLLRSVQGVDQIVARGDDLPDFDLQCPMLSMPLALGTTVATIPASPCYLRADPALVAAWRTRLAARGDGRKRIGLVWAGNPRSHAPDLAAIDRRRSIAPDLLAPLLGLPGLEFFTLQKDGPPAPAQFALTDHMAEMNDFADTAALIANLDLVISVDTAVAHLAAALGVPVWVLDRFDSCWRWLVGRRDSPWYPTLRIYRQPGPGNWGAVLADVVRDLPAFTGALAPREP